MLKTRRLLLPRIGVLSAIVAAVFVEITASQIAASANTVSSLPRVELSHLRYQGAFAPPESHWGALRYDGYALAFNPARDSLFMHARDGRVVEITIPAPVDTTNYALLNRSELLQEGLLDDQNKRLINNPADTALRGFLVDGPRLISSFASYYDASLKMTSSHLYRPTTLASTGQVQGPFKIGSVYPRHLGGHMSWIPNEWQPLLGGKVLTGNWGLPILTAESWGPAAFAFDPVNLGVTSPVPATTLLDYPDASHALGPWNGQSYTWNATSKYAGMAFIRGTRSILFFGTHGTGPYCYGDGGAVDSRSGEWCYDPEITSKGNHAYPYVHQIWAYDANDLLAVKEGSKASWEPRPYAVWNISLLPNVIHQMPSAAYDPATQRLFITQGSDETDPASGMPVVHVFSVNTALAPSAPSGLKLIR